MLLKFAKSVDHGMCSLWRNLHFRTIGTKTENGQKISDVHNTKTILRDLLVGMTSSDFTGGGKYLAK